jgi:ATP-dependent RNA helicase DDX19/DBP5
MIFCHTRKTASWLAEKMRKDGHAVCLLSGELTVDERILVGHQTGRHGVV